MNVRQGIIVNIFITQNIKIMSIYVFSVIVLANNVKAPKATNCLSCMNEMFLENKTCI